MKTRNPWRMWSVIALVMLLRTSALAFYEPSLQRWINRDPIGINGGFNLFRFADNDPANLYDLFGLAVDCDALWKQIQLHNDRFNRDSELQRKFLADQYSALLDLYWIDRAGDTASALVGNQIGKGINAARRALTGKTVLQGEALGVDLARSGSLSGPAATKGASYVTEGIGGAIGGMVAARAGAGVASLGNKFARDYTTDGIRKSFQETVDSLNRDLNRQLDRLKDLRQQYRQDCK